MSSLFEAYGLADADPAPKDPQPQPRGMLGVAKDVGISALKGAIDVPESAVGALDLVTGGYAGKAAEAAGFRPAEAKAILDEQYSPEQKQAFQRVQAAQGFTDTLMEAVQNPSVIAHSVVESLPSMGAGGAVARGGMALAPRLAPVLASAIGEGAVQAGSAAEQARQESPDKLLSARGAGAAALSGVLDAAIAAGSGGLAKRLGIEDPDLLLAGAKANPVAAQSLTRRVLGGMVTEGLLEELPQSIQEQVLQNYGSGKPLDEGVNQAAVLGMLSGMAMGGGANMLPGHAVLPEKLPETGPMSRAANSAAPDPVDASPIAAGIDPAGAPAAAAAPVGQEPVVDPVLERIKTLQGADRGEALAAYNILSRDDAPKGVRQYNSRLLDDLLAKLEPQDQPSQVEASDPAALLASGMGRDPLQGALAQQRDEQTAQQNLDNWMARAEPLTLDHAQEIQGAAAERGMPMEVVPHSAGQGFTVVPAAWITPAMRGQVAAALPMDTTPTGVLRADATGNVVPETGAQAIDTRNAATEQSAERQRKNELGLTPDVEAAQAGIPRAPAAPDLTLASGDPFKSRGAAVRAQRKAGRGRVVEVDGGWVVRGATEAPGNHAGEVIDVPAREVPQIAHDTAPTGVLRADAAGQVAAETQAQRIDTRQAVDEQAAERQRKAHLGLTPDVEAVQAGVKHAPLPTAQTGDVLNKQGQPFKTKGAALRAQKAGGEVVQVQGGWVVRSQTQEARDVRNDHATVAASPADGGQRRDDARASGRDSAAAGDDAGGRVVHPAGSPAVARAEGESVRDAISEPAAAVGESQAAQTEKEATHEDQPVGARSEGAVQPGAAAADPAVRETGNAAGAQHVADAAGATHVGPAGSQAPDSRGKKPSRPRGARKVAAEDDVQFSRSGGASNGGDSAERVAALQKFFDGISAKWANAPDIVVVQNMQDPRVPEKVRKSNDAQRSQDSDEQVHGFHYEGKVYIVADAISGPMDAIETLAHEALGHYGLQGFFGEALKPIKQQIVAMRKKDVLAKAQAYGMPVTTEAVRAELGKGATAADVRKVIDMRLQYAAEEVLAEMAQTTPQLGFVKRAIAAIRTWLRAHVPGFSKLELTDDEIIRSYILPARGWVVRGEGTGARRASEAAPVANFSLGASGNTVATDRPLRASIMEAMNDTFNAPGKLSWWHKTVGTQYNLAQRSPEFKRVFDSVQDFIGDVSRYATEAADLAPKILPKLETWRDIGKAPIAAADNKAISAPIFEGTLLWARDERGRPIRIDDLRKQAEGLSAEAKAQRMLRAGAISENVLKMWKGLPLDQYESAVATRFDSQMLHAGVVWTKDELRSQFHLTNGQIALYKEFRASVDRSLTHLAVSDMARYVGEDVPAQARQEALASPDVDAAALILRDALLKAAEAQPDRNELLIDTAERVIEKADRARDLMDRGYAPLSRFGHYTVDVIDKTGERVYFGMFETAREAALMARKMKGNFPDAQITRGTVSQEEYKLFAGVSPETVELFGELLGLESQAGDAASKAFQTYIKVAKANRSAMKRLIERKGIAGFSEDVGRVLAGFVYSNARQTSQNLHMGEMTNAASEVSKGQGELKDQATKLVDYVKNPQEEAQGLRGLLFAQYLGGSVASALVNMLQPVQVTFPYLSQYGGAVKAAARMKQAVMDVRKKSTGDKALDAALKQAEEEGIVAPQEVHQLMAQARGRGVLRSGDGTALGDARARASNAMSRLTLAWGKIFGAAEQVNRRVTFIAAYRTAVEQGIADPAKFAEKAIAETQFVYNKGNKPNWARGAVGSTLFTFKQYSISYLELLHRMATQGGPEGKKAVLLALGMLFLFGGAGGLPFEQDAEDVVDGVMQRLGYNFSSKLAKKQFFEKVLGKELGAFADSGISGLPGAPIDVSGRLGMGNLIPGTGLLVDKADHTRDVTEFAGAAGDFATRMFKGANQLASGDVMGAGKDVAPRAAANAAKALEMYTTGQYKDDKGRKVIDVDGFDSSMKALGFQPAGVAQVQEATGLQQQLIAGVKQAEGRFAERWADAVAQGDQDALAKVREDISDWNAKNPDAPVHINRSQIASRIKAMREDKATRIQKTAPKAIRASVRQALETS